MAEHREPAVEYGTLSIELTVDYALARPLGDVPDPPLLLVLHGWGQTCRSFVRRFVPLTHKGLLVVAPQAPHPFYVSYEPKKVGFSWLTQYERDRAVTEFLVYMRRLLQVLDGQFDPGRTFLLGYSQGVSMAYRLAVSEILQPAGLVACNADLPPDVAATLPKVQPFPVLLVHGREDPMCPLAKADEARDTLTTQRFSVDTWVHDGGHEMPAEAVEHIGDWVAGR
jgi:phospholipase/carboxylesterase